MSVIPRSSQRSRLRAAASGFAVLAGVILLVVAATAPAGQGVSATGPASVEPSSLGHEASTEALARALLDARSLRAFEPRRFTGATDVAFSSDGSHLAVVDFPCAKRVTVMDVESVETVLVHKARARSTTPACDASAAYSGVAFAPGDRAVLAADRTGTDIVAPSGTAVPKVSHVDGTHAVSPRDHRVAVPAERGRSVLFMDDERHVRQTLSLDGEQAVEEFFTADGSRLIVRTRQSLLVWDTARLAAGESLGGEAGPAVRPLRIALDSDGAVKRVSVDFSGDRIAVLRESRVHVWDLRAGTLLGTIQAVAGARFASIALWPGRDLLVTGGSAKAGEPIAAVWAISSGKYLGALLTGSHRKVTAVAFDPAGQHLAAVDDKGNLALWLFPRRAVKSATRETPPRARDASLR